MEKLGEMVEKIYLYFISGQKVILQEANGELNPKQYETKGKEEVWQVARFIKT